MGNFKRHWAGLEELRNDQNFIKAANREFSSPPTDGRASSDPTDGINSHRRDFLKTLGFGMAAVTIASCETPIKKAVPYVNKPVDEYPTLANWYASTFVDGGDFASVLVKTREGRPIKLEANELSRPSHGVSARAQASLLALYDIDKLKGPTKGNNDKIEWPQIDKEIVEKLKGVSPRSIAIISNTILSPTTKSAIADFANKYPGVQHITYDPNSSAAIVKAHQDSFGKAVIPHIDFSQAKTVVSIEADFLGTWIAPQLFSCDFTKTRQVSSAKEGKKEMSRHYQFESILSLTGANADYRSIVKPSQLGLVALALYNKIAGKLGSRTIEAPAVEVAHLDKAANDLVSAAEGGLVVSGINDPAVQTMVIAINSLLGAYGKSIHVDIPLKTRQGNDTAFNEFVDRLKGGDVEAVFFLNANPVYDHPRGAEIAEAIKKTSLSVSFADRSDETSSLVQYIAPAPHFLENWGDAEPLEGVYSLIQPTISHIYNTRQAEESLLTWAGQKSDYHQYLKASWRNNQFTKANGKSFDEFWIQSLHDGVFGELPATSVAKLSTSGNINVSAQSILKNYKSKSSGIELVIYEKTGIGNGSMANNPWLQELPEPVSKACWDNYACLSQKTAADLGVEQGDIVKIEINGKSIEVPALIQPGQASETVAVAIGYGREKAGRAANGVGKNIYPLATFRGGFLNFYPGVAKVSKTGDFKEIAQTQTHDTVMERKSILQETILSEFKKDPKAGRYFPKVVTSEGAVDPTDISLWSGHKYNGHSWGMVIDLNSCFGCSACIVSCIAENNIPVVGRQEVINRREMHWLRIDRYYTSDASPDDRKGLEIASENPEVTFQPMLCQHCNNAPCETVCPVLATTHSSEGLNQMAYNRCVGTRYCANNCPYKVRRFNWFKYFDSDNFDYNFNNDLGKMAINPDVTTRSRGVIEKCSMCVQRIQEGKLTAKKERRSVTDADINTACSSVCPTGAITFGDMNNPESKIAKLLEIEKEGRAYHVLEEINVRPQISYLSKIRNKDSEVVKSEVDS